MKDYRDLEKRFKQFNFYSSKPVIKEWKKTDTTNKVYDLEFKEQFRSSEERLLYRVDVWIEVCRIDNAGKGKFSALKNNKKTSTLSKLRSLSIGKMVASKSVDNLDSVHFNEVNQHDSFDKLARRIRKEQGKERQLSTSLSTIDLTHKTSDRELLETAAKYGTAPKRKFKFFLFRKKGKTPSSSLNPIDNYSMGGNVALPSNVSENNNKRSENVKHRPSLFDMKSLHENAEHEYDPDTKSFKLQYDKKFSTVNGVFPISSEGFRSVRNDSLNRYKSNTNSAPFFYSPSPQREADIGHY